MALGPVRKGFKRVSKALGPHWVGYTRNGSLFQIPFAIIFMVLGSGLMLRVSALGRPRASESSGFGRGVASRVSPSLSGLARPSFLFNLVYFPLKISTRAGGHKTRFGPQGRWSQKIGGICPTPGPAANVRELMAFGAPRKRMFPTTSRKGF